MVQSELAYPSVLNDLNPYRDFRLFRIEVPDGPVTLYIAAHQRALEGKRAGYLNDTGDPTLLYPIVDPDFAYGRTRLEPFVDVDYIVQQNARESTGHLALIESHMKHEIINRAIREGALNDLVQNGVVTRLLTPTNPAQQTIYEGYRLPDGYMDLRTCGGRCVMAPGNKEAEKILKNPRDPRYKQLAQIIFKPLGNFLNGWSEVNEITFEGYMVDPHTRIPRGSVNLTLDYGPFAKTAEIVNEFTPQVLGVAPESGGCGGKSSYTVSGTVGGLDACIESGMTEFNSEVPVTVIGSAGGVGAGIIEYLKQKYYEGVGSKTVRLFDLQYGAHPEIYSIHSTEDILKIKGLSNYLIEGNRVLLRFENGMQVFSQFGESVVITDRGNHQSIPGNWDIITSEEGVFTPTALENNGYKGIIIATTWGHELEQSEIDRIPKGTTLLLAHNKAIPIGTRGIALVKSLQSRGILAIPGQLLTNGGALTSRLEAAHRAHYQITFADAGKSIEPFPKRLAHEIAYLVGLHGVREVLRMVLDSNQNGPITPWEAMFDYAGLTGLLSSNMTKDLIVAS